MKKLLSLSLMLSLGLASFSPALNAAQRQSNPSGWQAAKKWFRSGRNMNALTPQEKKAFDALKTKVGITALVTGVVVLLGGGAAAMKYRKQQAAAERAMAEQRAEADQQTLNTRLMDAVRQGHADVVRQLIAAGANVNATDEDGRTALIWAAYGGHADEVEILLEAGADVNAADDQIGYTALIKAAEWGHAAVVRQLIAAGADVNAADRNGMTALMYAAVWGHAAVVEILLEAGANVNAASRYGSTALMVAALDGHADMVEILLPQSTPENRERAAQQATEQGHLAIAQRIREYDPAHL